MNILNKILEAKEKEITNLPALSLRPRKTISLIDQFQSKHIGIIAEVKKGSPSQGLIVKKLDLTSLISHYNQTACAVSVLTDQNFFYGNFNHIKEVRPITDLPILCKDFIISSRQIDHAYEAGADAILLIKNILSRKSFENLLNYAKNLCMDVLAEVDCLENFKEIEDLDFKLCGINNRNLNDFSIDYNKTLALAPYIKSKGKLVISESGIESRQDILKLRGSIDGCLIGHALVRNPALLKDLSIYKNRIQIKLCGIKDLNHAVILDGKVDFIGLVFCDSRRQISLEQASLIRSVLKETKLVGVFRNQSKAFIEKCYQVLNLDFVQLYEVFDQINIENHKIIYSIDYNQSPKGRGLHIIESKNPGSGNTFNTKKLKGFTGIKYFIAGGINISNVEKKVASCNCIGVDLSSGVEINGLKSEKLMVDFIKKVGDL